MFEVPIPQEALFHSIIVILIRLGHSNRARKICHFSGWSAVVIVNTYYFFSLVDTANLNMSSPSSQSEDRKQAEDKKTRQTSHCPASWDHTDTMRISIPNCAVFTFKEYVGKDSNLPYISTQHTSYHISKPSSLRLFEEQ